MNDPERRNDMNNRAQAVILELAGRCATCGQVRCGSPKCFRAALAYRAARPVLSAGAAANLVARLTRGPGAIPRPRALEYVRALFTVLDAA